MTMARTTRRARPGVPRWYWLITLIAGCGGTGDTPAPPLSTGGATPSKSASITVSAPAGEGKGKTTVTWDTGDGSIGQVFVSVDGRPDTRMFAQGKRGSKEADWIAGGKSYEFRLYAGKEHKQRLASASIDRPRSAKAASITVSPVTGPEDVGQGKTTVTWDTGDGSIGQVFVSVDGRPDTRMFAQGKRGSKEADWIAGGKSYEFRLYAGKEHKQLLATAAIADPRPAEAATGSGSEAPGPGADARKDRLSQGRSTGPDRSPH
jgi:hypothetical protein